MRNLCVRTLTV